MDYETLPLISLYRASDVLWRRHAALEHSLFAKTCDLFNLDTTVTRVRPDQYLFRRRSPDQQQGPSRALQGNLPELRRRERSDCLLVTLSLAGPIKVIFCVYGVVLPILDNTYLHYVLDEWFRKQYGRTAQGMFIYAVMGVILSVRFNMAKIHSALLQALTQRLACFGLEVAEKKSQIMEFSHCKEKAKTKFDFLGFEFRWGVNRWGKPILKRRTSQSKLRASLANFKEWFQKHSGLPKKFLFAKLNRKLLGYYNYFGVTGNFQSLNSFVYQVKDCFSSGLMSAVSAKATTGKGAKNWSRVLK